MATTVLIADDDATIVNLFHLDAENREMDIVIRSSHSGEATIEALKAHTPDVLILDIRMPQGDGFFVLDYMQKNNLTIPVMILTNYRKKEYLELSKQYSNVREYVIKHETRMNRVLDTARSYIA